MIELTYWFMFPLAILVATIAMSMGVGGALFFSPIFILLFPALGVASLSPAEAIGAALITELFGFTSGLFGYIRKKLIDFKTGGSLIMVGLPMAVVGSIVKHLIPGQITLIIFSVGLMLMGLYTIRTNPHQNSGLLTDGKTGPKRSIVDAEGQKYEYDLCNQNAGKAMVATGGLFTGMISVGIGETVVSTLRARCGLPMKVASATSVFVVTVVVLTASVTDVIIVGLSAIPWTLLLFTIPGVLVGGQLGPRVAARINEELAERFLVAMFFIIGLLMGYIAIF